MERWGTVMPASQLIFFAGWVVVALLGAALLCYVGPRLCAKLGLR
jgi:hypothetical protein